MRTTIKCWILTIFSTAFLAVGTSVTAHASLICPVSGECYGTASIGPASTDITSYSLVLPKWDSSWGTLTGVRLYFSGSETVSSFTITDLNESGSDQFGAYILSNVGYNASNSANNSDRFNGIFLVLFNTGDSNIPGAPACQDGSNGIPPGNSSGNGCPSSGQITLNAGQTSADYGPYTVSNTDPQQSHTLSVGSGFGGVLGEYRTLSSADWANYEQNGGGTFALGGATQMLTTWDGGGGNFQVSQSTAATIQAEVDYTFTGEGPPSAPEPASMGLVGSALIALGVLAGKLRRRTR